MTMGILMNSKQRIDVINGQLRRDILARNSDENFKQKQLWRFREKAIELSQGREEFRNEIENAFPLTQELEQYL